jgi:hypothetical protein
LLLNSNVLFKRVKNKNIEFWIGVSLWAIVPFFLFTLAKTKVRWYILPIYPPIAIAIGVMTSRLLHKGKLLTKVILSISILSVAAYYEFQIGSYVNNPPSNPKQSLIEKVTNNVQTKSDHLYIYHQNGTVNWLQSEVLTADLANDLTVENGDFKEFSSKAKALLMIPKQLYSNSLLKSNRLKVIASNQWGYLVCKQS